MSEPTTRPTHRQSTNRQIPGRLPHHIRLLRRLDRGEAGPYQVGYTGRIAVPAADGTPLLADHYQPLGEGEFPTLLIRSPYGRGFPYGSVFGFAHAAYGFHVLVQSCRGTGGSGGTFTWWRDETADGLATVAWLREQPWFTGDLGLVGPSYLAYTQWAIAMDPPPELRALVVQIGLHDPYGLSYRGGAFALENSMIAAVAVLYQGRGAWTFLRAVLRLRRRLSKVFRSLPLIDAYVPGLGQRVPHLDGVLRHPDAGAAFWDGTDLGAAAERLTVPTKVIAGWHDTLLDQNLQQYARLRAAGCPTSLLIGPWTHTSMLEVDGKMVLAHSVDWLRAHLSRDRSGPGASAGDSPVRIHVGGADEWHDLPDWPPPAVPNPLYLHPGTDAGLLKAPHPETTVRPEAARPETPQPKAVRPEAVRPETTWSEAGRLEGPPVGAFRYDPGQPTPSVGGALLSRHGGVRDNTKLEARADVLTFSTEPLVEPWDVMGEVTAQLRVAAKAGSNIDIFARLCDVDKAGRSRNVCDGLLRLPAFTDDRPVEVTIGLSSTAHRFLPGHRVRLQVSGGAHPRFARNTGSGEPPGTATRLVCTDVTVLAGSVLWLPRVTADANTQAQR